MLLPQTIAQMARHEYRLAIDQSNARLAGAVAFADNGERFYSLHLHVTDGCRRQGVGTTLLEHVLAQARLRGRTGVSTSVDPARDPATHAFLLHRGFRTASRFLTAEGDMAAIHAAHRARCGRAAYLQNDRWRILPLTSDMLGEAGRLHAEYLSDLSAAGAAGYFVPPPLAGIGLSQVLVVGGSIQGILLVTRRGDVATFEARVVRPAFRHSRGSAALVMRALDATLDSGARRLRFCYFASTRDTAAVVRRMGIPVVETLDHLTKAVS
jgi:GNAT superfamily N-acetyltransferase